MPSRLKHKDMNFGGNILPIGGEIILINPGN